MLRVSVNAVAQPGSAVVRLKVRDNALVKQLIRRGAVLQQELNAYVSRQRRKLYCSSIGREVVYKKQHIKSTNMLVESLQLLSYNISVYLGLLRGLLNKTKCLYVNTTQSTRHLSLANKLWSYLVSTSSVAAEGKGYSSLVLLYARQKLC